MTIIRMSTQASQRPLTEEYDVALLDLDGVAYVGELPVAHAARALADARSSGMRIAFVTNNASRTPEAVASRLASLGIPADPRDVVTSAQAAARMVAEIVPAGAAVLCLGAVGLVEALREQGLSPVFSADDQPSAVVQGYDPDLSWRTLAEGAYALNAGVPWVASNADLTLPTPRGLAPGNGAFVNVLRETTGREPLVAGKPETPMHREAVIRSGARHPLVVGDRLDTDIEAANRVEVDSLLVLTGVTDPVDFVFAAPRLRPSFVAADLRGLVTSHPAVTVNEDGWARCGVWAAGNDDGGIRLIRESEEQARATAVDALRAIAAAVWSSEPDRRPEPSDVAALWARVDDFEQAEISRNPRRTADLRPPARG